MLGITGGESFVLAVVQTFRILWSIECLSSVVLVLLSRFVAALLNRSEKEELDYTTEMIENNLSNYSAWHNQRYGSICLQLLGAMWQTFMFV